MVVIDASIWVPLIKRDDDFRRKAKDLVRYLTSKKKKIAIPALAFTEVAGAIKRTTKNKKTALDAVKYMKVITSRVLTNLADLEPIATKIAIDYDIKGADAYYLAVAKTTKSRLYTFDEEQEKAFEEISKSWKIGE